MKQAVRQTRTHIGELLARAGLRPRHDLGQNFLVDLNLVEYLVGQADLGPDDVVLEVGSGTGGLTTFLAEKARAVIAVEVDPRMRDLTAAAAAPFDNVTIVGCDVLKNKNRLAQPVLDALDAALNGPSPRLKLVANLPYCVATPVISNLVASDYSWTLMAVTIQLELAQRMTAAAGTGDYGALSVWMAARCRVQLLKKLPPDVFWPRPKVESAMVLIHPDAARSAAVRSRVFLQRFLRDVFQQRRKLLRSVLVARFGDAMTRAQIDATLCALDLGERVRAEELPPEQLVALCAAVEQILHQSRGDDLPSLTTA